MKERQVRLETIKKLIKTCQIESQEILLDLLRKEGFDVTQATLSRDLKVLKVGKISNNQDIYTYSFPVDEKPEERTFANDFLRGYISINWSGNIVVIKTHSGHSDSVAMALDTFELTDVLGTISGRDNAVFVVLREGVKGEAFIKSLKKFVPELE